MCRFILPDQLFDPCLKFPDLINEKQFLWSLIPNGIDGTHYLLSIFIMISFSLPLFLSLFLLKHVVYIHLYQFYVHV